MSEEKILIVEDCESTANYLIYCLEKLGYRPLSPLRTGEEALDKISGLKPDLILMDVELEGKLNGIETAALLRKKHDIPILYLTSHSEDEFLQQAKITEPYAYLIKPVREKELCANVEMALYRHKTEKHLLHTRKMDALGTLAGGIAHNFNNILVIIIGYAELAIDDLSEDNPIKENLKEILSGGLRARNMIQQILSFCQISEQEKMPMDIGSLLEENLSLLRCSAPGNIDIRHHITAEQRDIQADMSQIQQVIIQLCINAFQAMEEKGGILDIRLASTEICPEDISDLNTSASPGDKYIELTVADTGHGMSPEIMERIFDPFFTTGEIFRHSGMGLAVVHGIVKNHGGFISVSSEPGKGSTFRVLLPSM